MQLAWPPAGTESGPPLKHAKFTTGAIGWHGHPVLVARIQIEPHACKLAYYANTPVAPANPYIRLTSTTLEAQKTTPTQAATTTPSPTATTTVATNLNSPTEEEQEGCSHTQETQRHQRCRPTSQSPGTDSQCFPEHAAKHDTTTRRRRRRP